MAVNIFTYAVPVFIGAMLTEAAVTFKRGRPAYGFADTLTNLGCGLGSQLTGLFLATLTLAGYSAVYEHLRLFSLAGDSAFTWVLAVLGGDLIYYAWHRLSHEVNVLWATHVVHHQSERYNLSVALRQSWFGNAFSWAFYLPLAILGVPPAVFLLSGAINLLYQFVIHTEVVRTLGPLEWLFNTPSHHRVHHGSNEAYLDQNYGGIFIVWDRLFGTFVPETTPVVYGLVKPLKGFDPVWANLHHWVDLARQSAALPRWRDKLRVWFKNPGWQPGDESPADAVKRAKALPDTPFAVSLSRPRMVYLFGQFCATLAATVAVMIWGRSLPNETLVLLIGGTFAGMTLWEGLLLRDSTKVVRSETVRLVLLIVAGGFVLALKPDASLIAGAVMVFAAGSLAALRKIPR